PIFSSPTFHLSDLMNWITQTLHPRASARRTTPKAAVDLPLPSPVLTSTSERGRTAGGGGRNGGSTLGFILSFISSHPFEECGDVEAFLDDICELFQGVMNRLHGRLTEQRAQKLWLLEQSVQVDTQHGPLDEPEAAWQSLDR